MNSSQFIQGGILTKKVKSGKRIEVMFCLEKDYNGIKCGKEVNQKL